MIWEISMWARFIFWVDENLNHHHTADAHPRWRWLCNYNDYLITGKWFP